MIRQLQRVTSEYIETEDRIRLNGLANQAVTSIWLSRRLADRLVNPLVQWLEKQQPQPTAEERENFLNFAQHAAQEATRQEASPPVTAEKQASENWLALTIQVQSDTQALTMIFCGIDDPQKIALKMQPDQLRQWLDILYRTYLRAEWPTELWPDWIKNNTPPSARQTNHRMH